MQRELKSGRSKEIKIKEDSVGILLVDGKIMNGNGDYWMFPTTDLSYAIIKLTNLESVLDHYDLTGELSTQMPGLAKYMTSEYGYVLYKNNPDIN